MWLWQEPAPFQTVKENSFVGMLMIWGKRQTIWYCSHTAQPVDPSKKPYFPKLIISNHHIYLQALYQGHQHRTKLQSPSRCKSVGKEHLRCQGCLGPHQTAMAIPALFRLGLRRWSLPDLLVFYMSWERKMATQWVDNSMSGSNIFTTLK